MICRKYKVKYYYINYIIYFIIHLLHLNYQFIVSRIKDLKCYAAILNKYQEKKVNKL